MEQDEFVRLAQKDPNRLVLMLEHGKLKGEELWTACRVAGHFFPTEKIQRVLLRHLVTVTDKGAFKKMMSALSKHRNELLMETLRHLGKSAPNAVLRECARERVEWLEDDFDDGDHPGDDDPEKDQG